MCDLGSVRPMSVYVHVPFCVRRCGYCDFNTYTPRELGGAVSQADYADQVIAEIDLAAKYLEGENVPGLGNAARSRRNSEGTEPVILRQGALGSGRLPVGVAAFAPQSAESLKPSGVPTVFFGGGTPTMLPSADLVKILRAIDNTWGLMPDVEVTTEANPDSVTQESINELAAGGFTRISFGMQSAVPHVLRTLDRTHNREQIPVAVNWAKQAGLKVSVDLIYGTPGESLADWRESVEAAIATGVDHISAYALHVEPHTKMGRQIRNGELPAPDDDDEAAKYELADEMLSQAGLEWYEISNWVRSSGKSSESGDLPVGVAAAGGIGGQNVCQHNLAYWRGQNWWGFGPGAHSYFAGTDTAPKMQGTGMVNAGTATVVSDQADDHHQATGQRWWNVKHPAKYAQMLSENKLPIEEVEQLTPQQMALENVMLRLRLAEGLPIEALEASYRDAIAPLSARGLLTVTDNTLVLTRMGRLLADTVTRALT